MPHPNAYVAIRAMAQRTAISHAVPQSINSRMIRFMPTLILRARGEFVDALFDGGGDDILASALALDNNRLRKIPHERARGIDGRAIAGFAHDAHLEGVEIIDMREHVVKRRFIDTRCNVPIRRFDNVDAFQRVMGERIGERLRGACRGRFRFVGV